jgi:hypothetical protein
MVMIVDWATIVFMPLSMEIVLAFKGWMTRLRTDYF